MAAGDGCGGGDEAACSEAGCEDDESGGVGGCDVNGDGTRRLDGGWDDVVGGDASWLEGDDLAVYEAEFAIVESLQVCVASNLPLTAHFVPRNE